MEITPPDKKVYDSVPRTDDVFNLKIGDLVLHSELGSGNFGSVQLGNYKHKGQTIPVAVKTLKTSDFEAEVGVWMGLWMCFDCVYGCVFLVMVLGEWEMLFVLCIFCNCCCNCITFCCLSSFFDNRKSC